MKSADTVDAFVGSRVRLRRMTINMSQEKLGQALGLTFQQVQKYEKGLNRIGAGRLFRIGLILSVPVSYFFEGLPDQPDQDEDSEAVRRSVETQSFLSSPEGLALSRAFLRIEDRATRRRLVDLVNTIAAGEQ